MADPLVRCGHRSRSAVVWNLAVDRAVQILIGFVRHHPLADAERNRILTGAGIVIFVVAALIVFVGGGLLIASILGTQRQVNRLLTKIASKFNGSVSGTRNLPKVLFSKDDVSFVVESKYIKGNPYLTIYTGWPDATFRAKFFPETISDSMKTFIGMQDIKIGSPGFDSRFVIQSNDAHRLVEFLGPDVQSEIYAMGPKAVLNISGSKIQLERKIDFFSNEYQALNTVQQFVDACFVMRSASFDSTSTIEVKAISINSTDAVCMICGEGIAERRVVCRTCKTPHHQECWDYLRQCSTYGCGQKKYRIASKKNQIRIS